MKTRILVLLILPLLIMNMQTSTGTKQNLDTSVTSSFSENLLLSTSDTKYSHHVEPTLAISDNGILFAGWKDAFSHNGAGIRVSFSKSIDGGLSWSEPFKMPMFEEDTGQSDPWLVWHDETLYYAYLEYSLYSYEFSQITVAKSTDYGETWNLVAGTHGSGFADKETMTISNDGTIYIAYDDINIDTDFLTVSLTRSTNNGDSFDEIGVIADSTTYPVDHLGPYVVTDSNNDVYVTWVWFSEFYWGDVYLVASKDQGMTFSEEIDINPESENATFESTFDERPSRATLPVIQFDQNNRLYVLWAERFELNGEWDVYIRYSDDYGLSWSERYQVNPDLTGNQWQPDMDIDSLGRCHITWYDEQGDTYKPYYRTITFPEEISEEISYGDPIAIASADTSSSFTRPGDYFTICVDSNDIPHVVWTDGRNNKMDIYYSHGIAETSSSVTMPFTTATSIDTAITTTSTTTSVGFLGFLIPLALALVISLKKRN